MSWLDDHMNSVVQGDCLEIMKELPDNSVDLIFADPKYNVGMNYGLIVNDTVDENEYVAWCNLWLQECQRIARSVSITPGNSNQWLYPQPKWTMNWYKPNGIAKTPLTVGQKMCLCTWEPLLWYGDPPKNPPIHDTLTASIGKQRDTLSHPCPKPLRLMKRIVMMCNANDLILDPFAGSGTTLVAAKQLGRRYIGIEIEPKYVEIARQRLAQEVLAL